MERSILKIGRDIREIPNPAYNPESNKRVPKTVLSQEVYHYQVIRKRHTTRARIQIGMTCFTENTKKTLLQADDNFSDDGRKLEGLRMSSMEEQLDVPFMIPRVAASRDDLPVDPWPKGTPPALSSHAEIAEALQKYAMNLISEKALATASCYPVEVLAGSAVRNDKLGRPSEAADCWGDCLEYCSQLARDKADATWSEQKKAMQDRISELCRTSWSGCSSDIVARLPFLWSEAVDSTAAATAATR